MRAAPCACLLAAMSVPLLSQTVVLEPSSGTCLRERSSPPPVAAEERCGEAGLAAQVHWFDASGNLLSKWPANPLNGNPDFVKGDWRGNGRDELFWYRFRMNGEGEGVLSFKQDVYHMFDFLGTGSEQVISRGGTALQVYGYTLARPRSVKRDAAYRKKVANHTHY